MKKLPVILLALLALASCRKAETSGESRLVVEGWIENGGHPVVMLSESIGITTGQQMSVRDFMDHMARWAKVTVSDGEKSVVLTGVPDPEYFPPYIFTTDRIVGEVGKRYSLTVEFKDYVATATTVIPVPVPLDTVYVKDVGADSTATVMCGFVDPQEKGNYYKVFTRTEGRDSHYHPSTFAFAADDVMNGYTELFLFSTQRLMDFAILPNIMEGDSLSVKLCTMTEEIYRYWNDFEYKTAYSAFNQNPSGTDSYSNVSGALGYWAGYGVEKEKGVKIVRPAAATE